MHYIKKIFVDSLIFSFSFIIAFLLRFDLADNPNYINQLVYSIPIVILIRVSTFFIFKIYHNDYTYFSLPNVIEIFKSIVISSVIFYLIFNIYHDFFNCSKSLIIIDGFILLVLASGLRYLIYSLRYGHHDPKTEKQKVLIIGAGYEGESIARMIGRNNDYFPIGFIDNSPQRQGKIIQGIKVIGKLQDFSSIIKKENINAVIISSMSAVKKEARPILQFCEHEKIKVLTVSYLSEVKNGKILLNQIREVQPQDILGREQVKWDIQIINKQINNKTLLVTGAGGSIGSELCRQILRYKPGKLILFERSEYNIFSIENELKRNFSDLSINAIVGDVSDDNFISKIIARHKPNIIFHSAAYKHVYLMEVNPEVAIKNNILGTLNVARAAIENNIEKLVFISTDKAANPTSIMGASKRISEEIIREFAHAYHAKFCCVRFGNVLGSSGSVLPIFEEQLARGGPLTVTHIDVYRYFMTIPEAVHLVLSTLSMTNGGEIFILDMGKPVRIFDLARDFITRSGFKVNEDVDIVFTGLKPGEKLVEELYEKSEKVESTLHKRIKKIKDINGYWGFERLQQDISDLISYSSDLNREALYKKVMQMIPTYKPSAELYG